MHRVTKGKSTEIGDIAEGVIGLPALFIFVAVLCPALTLKIRPQADSVAGCTLATCHNDPEYFWGTSCHEKCGSKAYCHKDIIR